jgi:uroporphyrinogen-III synthase
LLAALARNMIAPTEKPKQRTQRQAQTFSPAAGTVPGRLRGRRIVIPSHRELDRLAAIIEIEGATAVRCPLVAILEAPDLDPIETCVRAVASHRFHTVLFLTAEGVTRLAEVAQRLGIREGFLQALRRTHVVTRGPKPACALYDLGIPVTLRSAAPTTAGVIAGLRARELDGRHVALQLFGDEPGHELVQFLEGAGAFVHPVAPYRYAPATDDDGVQALIEELARGELDAIVFTAAMQIERLFEVAQQRNRTILLQAGLAGLHVAAVGPAVVASLERLGVRIDTVPARQFFMRRLVEVMAERLGPARP